MFKHFRFEKQRVGDYFSRRFPSYTFLQNYERMSKIPIPDTEIICNLILFSQEKNKMRLPLSKVQRKKTLGYISNSSFIIIKELIFD